MSTPTTALTQLPGIALLNAPQTREFIKRAQAGDLSVLPHLRALLDDHPEIWQHCGELAAITRNAWVDLIAGNDLVVAESLQRKVAAMKAELLEPSPSPLERLLVDRVGICWLQVHAADLECAHAVSQGTTPRVPTAEVARKRLDSANRRYLAAVKQLTLVRKLLKEKPAKRLPRAAEQANPPALPPAQ